MRLKKNNVDFRYYPPKAKVVIKSPYKGDKDIVRMDKATMSLLKVKKGDVVEITASFWSPWGSSVTAIVDELMEDEYGIIRLSENKLREGNFKVGDAVIIRKINERKQG